MPKQGKSKTTKAENDERRAKIKHDREVQEILARRSTPFMRWSAQRHHLNMDLPSWRVFGETKDLHQMRRRGGLIVNDANGLPHYAIRRPHGGLEGDNMRQRLDRGYLVYVPEGLPGGRAGGPPVYASDLVEAEGRGKPKKATKAKGKAKRC